MEKYFFVRVENSMGKRKLSFWNILVKGATAKQFGRDSQELQFSPGLKGGGLLSDCCFKVHSVKVLCCSHNITFIG